MRFWDASALVPLLVAEPTTAAVQSLAAGRSPMLVWWAAAVECASAIARLGRDGGLDAAGEQDAMMRLKRLATGWHEVEPTDVVREHAIRFLRVHPLRTADALQLAAAYVAAEGRPPSLELITLDDRLAAAAGREGFVLIEAQR